MTEDPLLFAAPRALTSDADLAGFDCGDPSLNNWLTRRALAGQRSGASRTYFASPLGQESAVAGFYALAAGQAVRSDLPGPDRRNMPDPVPVVLLGRLAVGLPHQGLGLGSALVADAVRRAAAAAGIIGVRALVVHALPGAEDFYARLGFVVSPPGSGVFVASIPRLLSSLAQADQT
jgi:GNAT superfamily N-acetyltransferase